ncbi:preprotein translocase subunit SecG [Leptolyngbya sp. 'hensonii']|uniref:preprotein translocase subunit SecG n=1 Tax=Leptolyngbya sp. 'hensonii' TaxID=1922337 RepID=UPI00094F5EC8|nr:preprotein translocase subunit SecG [Leptolyngbya sp. 'hensonii']OLP18658.1 preprotein translocase subunit SecG [Leptolyngbya sp. 'hensonii']
MTIVTILKAIWSTSALGLIILVLLHSPKGDGIGGIGGQAQLFTSTRSAETNLNRITWILAVLFIGLTIILSANWLGQSVAVPVLPSTPPSPQ